MLIKCQECSNEVSDKAASCPRCGAPVSSGEAALSASKFPPPSPAIQLPQTIEQTSKQWKTVQLVSMLLIVVGTVSCVAQATTFAAITWCLGLAGYFWSRFGAWWDNG